MPKFAGKKKNESGIALVELALLLIPLVFIILAGLECTSYMRQKQIVQMLSRETAVSVFKKCSGLDAAVAGTVNDVQLTKCLENVSTEMTRIYGAASTATFDIGLYRCDPPDPAVTAPCATPVLIKSQGNVSEFTSRAQTAGTPLRSLLSSQRVAVVVRVSFPYKSSIVGNVWNSVLSVFRLGNIADVTIV